MVDLTLGACVLAPTTKACQRCRVRTRRRSTRGAAQKRAASFLPTSPLYSTSAVKTLLVRQSVVHLSIFSIFTLPQPLEPADYYFPIARTQLVSTKHRRLEQLDWESTSTPPHSWYGGKIKKHMSISSNTLRRIGRNKAATRRALRRITDLHSLTTIAKMRAFHLFSISFCSRPI